MLNHYETVFIVNPVLSDDQVKETVNKFKHIIIENGGEVLHDEYWGLKKLAYPIKHKESGYYQLYEFKAPGTLIAKLEIEFKRDEQIIRFQTVRLDKYSAAYAEKRRQNRLKKKEEKSKDGDKVSNQSKK